MLEAGALEEARAALPDWQPRLPSSRAIGGPELIDFLQAKSTLSGAIDAAILASRRYAKRQRTWFRSRMGAWQEFPCS
jgi:tRNA dimethylallyltransferase